MRAASGHAILLHCAIPRLLGAECKAYVPESEKKKLWSDIQTKICAVGVAQRSVKEIRRRWYDLHSRAKESVASRLKKARSTGGGPPTQTPSTPMEDMMESILLPEAVSGVTDIDASGTPGTSKGKGSNDVFLHMCMFKCPLENSYGTMQCDK
ncbi:hypothetical protein NDU88_003667 [Pleurodeles waltl]|uniref:Myb/SANT-like DNA-binding domain-containing protein n=1 Tax=Pleurodeles waltl TaxID=8319 RepID=A0AAV7VE17_PLEWA|nr:hypothetical protein NDU88_003667 [Pleurodeles waltl]